MSTLPLLYSARSLQKRPSKQGGIFALNATNRSSTPRSSIQTSSLSKMESPETSELVRNNISQYYFLNSSRDQKKKSITMSIHRYAKSNFIDNQIKDTVMVVPDTLKGRHGEQIDSVGTINRNIGTAIVLANAVLTNDTTQLKDLKKDLDQLNTKIVNILDDITKQSTQKFSQLYETLSALRRQTLMQTKINNGQVSKLIEDSSNTQLIANSIEEKTKLLSKECNI